MIRKRKLLILSVLLLVLFIGTTNFLLTLLSDTENDVQVLSVQKKIYRELGKLSDNYKIAPNSAGPDIKIDDNSDTSFEEIWKTANSWVTQMHIVDINSPAIGRVLNALKNAKIIKADLDTRGTQLKFLLTLEGNQNVIFKPKWYDIEKIIEGPVYAGKDRFGSEIVAFYLSVILNMPWVPCSAERTISLTQDIMPVATKQLLNTSFSLENRTCIYGKCFYCQKEDPICENSNLQLTGAVIFNINGVIKHYRSPWQRTYKKSKKALWEESDKYCKTVKEKLPRKRLLDLIDASIFDFLIQNGDRHHYETLHDNVILLDNGKGFGNPNEQHLDILAPLYQCCIVRSATFKKLQRLTGGSLSKKLKTMPNIQNILTEAHLKAINERLLLVFATLEYCRNRDKINEA